MNKNQIKTDMQNLLDNLTKPVGSLGDLERIAVNCAQIQHAVPPQIKKKATYVFAADHGIVNEGVSLYPQEVTRQMVLNFLNGGAAINVLSRHCGFDVFVIDAGVNGEFNDERVIDLKVAKGTDNFSRKESMSANQLETCLENGKKMAEKVKQEGYDLVAIGDMGIGNTTSAAALLIASGFSADTIIDRGTGISAEALDNKISIIKNALAKHSPFANPRQIMQKVGGFELNTICGFILGLAGSDVTVVIDGFPVTSAAYMAYTMDNSVIKNLFAGHKSKVKGHAIVLEKLGLKPIVNLNMRLGEGTGAVIGGFIIELSLKIADEMASFNDAAVSKSNEEEMNY